MYDIIKAHGGELKVETKEGEGSEFIIEMPVVWITDLLDKKITWIQIMTEQCWTTGKPTGWKLVCQSILEAKFRLLKD